MTNRRSRLSASVAVVASAALLVVGTDYVTFAATGDSLLLGKRNSAGKTTALKNSGTGAALNLSTRAGAPPLKVSSAAKVVKLNADQVDGKGAGELGVRTQVFTATGTFGTATQFVVPALTPGDYLVNYSVWFVTANGTADNPQSAQCYLLQEGTHYTAPASTVSVTQYPGVSGSGAIELGPELDTRLICEMVGSKTYWTAEERFPVELVLTRIDSYGETSMPAARHSDRRAGAPTP